MRLLIQLFEKLSILQIQNQCLQESRSLQRKQYKYKCSCALLAHLEYEIMRLTLTKDM